MLKKDLLKAVSGAIAEMEQRNLSRLTRSDNGVQISECQKLSDNLSKILAGFDENGKLDETSSLEPFNNSQQLKNFLLTSNAEQIKHFNDCVCTDMMTMMKNSVNATTVETIRRMENHRSKFTLIFFCLLAVTVTALLTLQILALCGILAEMGDIISSIIGAFDLLLGVTFFAYEKYDDLNKKKFYRQAEEAKQSDPGQFISHYNMQNNVQNEGNNNITVIGNKNKIKIKSMDKRINEYEKKYGDNKNAR